MGFISRLWSKTVSRTRPAFVPGEPVVSMLAEFKRRRKDVREERCPGSSETKYTDTKTGYSLHRCADRTYMRGLSSEESRWLYVQAQEHCSKLLARRHKIRESSYRSALFREYVK